jgi:Leucine-rich repeat (LRR) protein
MTNNPTLTTLPASISSLRSLERLALDGCGLSELPAEIGAPHMLQRLWLTDNRLTHLPHEISQLTSLNTLFVNKVRGGTAAARGAECRACVRMRVRLG